MEEEMKTMQTFKFTKDSVLSVFHVTSLLPRELKKKKRIAKGRFKQSLHILVIFSKKLFAPLATWLNHFYMVPSEQEAKNYL